MEGGSLLERLQEGELLWNTRLLMAIDIAKGIQVLHCNKPQVQDWVYKINIKFVFLDSTSRPQIKQHFTRQT